LIQFLQLNIKIVVIYHYQLLGQKILRKIEINQDIILESLIYNTL